MTTRQAPRVLARSTVLTAVLAAGCGGTPGATGSAGVNAFSGVVSMGTPVVGTVHLESIGTVDGSVVADFGTTSTDGAGAFSISAVTPSGPGRICASGAFADPATGAQIQTPDGGLCLLVPELSHSADGLAISAWSELAIGLTQGLVRNKGMGYLDAWAQAVGSVDSFIGCATAEAGDFLAVAPEDPTVPHDISVGLSAGLIAGIELAGLSQQAKLGSESLGLTPGVKLTSIHLAQACFDDVFADTYLDGRGRVGAPIAIDGYDFGPDTMRAAPLGFVQGIRRFVESPRNATGATVADVGDLLACLSANESSIFRTPPGGSLDLAGPTLTFVTPTPGATVNGEVALRVTALDPSGVAVISVTQGQDVMTAITPTIDGKSAELTAAIDTTAFPQGPFTMQVSASDIYGNASTAQLTLTINNNAPVITIESPAANAVVGGVITISASATASDVLTALELRTPASLVDTDSAVDRVSATLNTSEVAEGPLLIKLFASDATGNMVEKTISVTVDNLKPGLIEGVAGLDSPLRNGRVEVLGYVNGIRGAVLASGNVADGTFSVAMPDNYAGPVLIRVFGAGAYYRDAATTQNVYLGTADELVSIADYAPSAAGTVVGGLAVDLLTTLATFVTARFMDQAMTFDDARDLAFELFAVHIKRPDPFDLRTMTPSDFSSDPADDLESNLRVGLWHVGLSRLGAQIATGAGLQRTAFNTLDMLPVIYADLEDAVFNGKDDHNNTIALLPGVPLATNTLRSQQAKALLGWLLNTPLADGYTGANTTTVDPGLAGAPGGLLDCIAMDRSRLFGPDPLEEYDLVGPTVTVVSPASDPAYLEGLVTLEATATDPSGVSKLTACLVNGTDCSAFSAAFGLDQDLSPGHLVQTLDVSKLGSQSELRFIAADTNGNRTTVRREITLDNQPPQVEIGFPAVVAPGAALTVTATDPTGIPAAPMGGALNVRSVNVMCTFGVDQDPSAARFAGVLDAPSIYSCDGAQTLRVTVSDLRGNATQVDRPYVIDRTPPTLAVNFPTGVHQEAFTLTGAASDVGSSVASITIMVNGGAPVIIQNPGATWSQALTVPCAAFSTIHVTARDQAGLETSQEAQIVCEFGVPTLTLGASQYLDESTLTASWDSNTDAIRYDPLSASSVALGAADWANSGVPFQLKKYYNRLDYLPASLYDEITNNLPYLRFSGADATGPSATPPGELEATYDYWVDGTLRRDWTPLTVEADGSFKLIFGYQTLGASLADAAGNKHQLIHVKLVDLAGNAATMLFYFRMQAMVPSVVYTECDVGDLAGKTLAAKTLHQWFQGAPNPTAFSGRIYLPELPPGSAAPWTFSMVVPGVQVTVAEDLRHWRVEYPNGLDFPYSLNGSDSAHPTSGSCRPACPAMGDTWSMWQDATPEGVCYGGLTPDHGISTRSGGAGAGAAQYNCDGQAEGILNPSTGRWDVPLSSQERDQSVGLEERTQGPRTFPMADYAPSPSNYAWPTRTLNGTLYYFVREFDGMDYKYRCQSGSPWWDYRRTHLSEYVAEVRFTVAAVQPQVFITGNPSPLSLLVPAGETCGQTLSYTTTEP
jgi:hypothetical protein